MSRSRCRDCGWQTAWAKGLCHACYAYRRRHNGSPRPMALIEQHAERFISGRVPWAAKRSAA